MAIPRHQSAYWSRVAAAKEFAHPLRLEFLGDHLRPEHRILDLGCGYGRLIGELWERGFRNAVGVDSAAGMIERGASLRPDLDLRVIEHGPLPFGDGAFDAVLLFSVLTCIPAPAEQEAVLSEIERVLAPGGILYVSDLLLQDDGRNRARYEEGEARYGVRGVFELPEGVVLTHLTTARLEELTASFRRLAFEELEVRTMNDHAARAFQFLGSRRTP